LARGEKSAIYRATCPGISHPLLIKQTNGDGASVLSQYDALRSANKRLCTQLKLRVPRAYPYLLDDGFLVTDWVDAPTVKQLLEGACSRPNFALFSLELAGKWLSAFHGDGEFAPAYVDTERLVRSAQQALARAGGWRVAPRRFESDFALLQLTAPTLKHIAINTTVLHGDFKPANIIINKDCAFGIDIAGEFKGPVVDDLAHFLLHLDLSLLTPWGWRWLPWRGRLSSAFLRGYDPAASTLQPIILAWTRLQRVLRHYSDQTVAGGRTRATVLKWSYATCAKYAAMDLKAALARAGTSNPGGLA
jgi:tRNA A-37 threonylcarbamoyl transferase component Bud32